MRLCELLERWIQDSPVVGLYTADHTAHDNDESFCELLVYDRKHPMVSSRLQISGSKVEVVVLGIRTSFKVDISDPTFLDRILAEIL